MSVKNKTKDRNSAGRIKRKYTGPDTTCFYKQVPKWWTVICMTRPKRRANKRACKAVMKGIDSGNIVYPLGNKKPHTYYW